MLEKTKVVKIVVVVIVGLIFFSHTQWSKSVQRDNIVPTFHNTVHSSKI